MRTLLPPSPISVLLSFLIKYHAVFVYRTDQTMDIHTKEHIKCSTVSCTFDQSEKKKALKQSRKILFVKNDDEIETSDWRKEVDSKGNTFYYNRSTHESQWTDPSTANTINNVSVSVCIEDAVLTYPLFPESSEKLGGYLRRGSWKELLL